MPAIFGSTWQHLRAFTCLTARAEAGCKGIDGGAFQHEVRYRDGMIAWPFQCFLSGVSMGPASAGPIFLCLVMGGERLVGRLSTVIGTAWTNRADSCPAFHPDDGPLRLTGGGAKPMSGGEDACFTPTSWTDRRFVYLPIEGRSIVCR